MKSGEAIPLGNFHFDPAGPVVRDGDMKVVPLRAQTLKVLARLCEEPGEIIEKAKLFDDIWPDTHVTDASLVQCIREIRTVLQDGDFELVRTFPRQGYMVVPSKEPGATGHTPTRFPTLAVLPFAGEENAECKLSYALTADLAKYPVLSVISNVTVAVLSGQSMQDVRSPPKRTRITF